jgi:hypothetical protein
VCGDKYQATRFAHLPARPRIAGTPVFELKGSRGVNGIDRALHAVAAYRGGMLVQSIRRVILAALAGVLLGPLAATTAGAAPAWFTPVDISAGSGEAATAQVAVDPRGNAVALWEQSEGNDIIVQGAVRPAGESWQAPVNLSAPGQDAGDPQVAVDAQGNAVAVWTRRDNAANAIVQGAVRAAGGSWQAPVNLSAAGHTAVSPQVAVDPQGNAVAVWQRFNSRGVLVVQGVVRPVGGGWRAPVELSASDQNPSVHPQVAVDASGDAVAVWKDDGASSFIVKGAVLPAGGAWQAPVDISAPGRSDPQAAAFGQVFPQVAVDAQGNMVAVWDHPTGSASIVQGAVRTAGGTWQTPVNISVPGQDASDPQVAVDAQGNTIVVWGRSIGTKSIVQGAERAAGGPWQAPVNLSTASQSAVIPRVGVGPQGTAVAVWSVDRLSTQASSSIVQGAVRAAGGAWQTPVNISAAGFSPDIAVDAQGSAVAVWGRSTSTRYIVEGDGGFVIQSADYRATRPPAVAAAVARLRLSPSTFRAGRTVRAVPPRATRVSYTLDVAASVRFTVQRLSTGRKVAGRCVKATGSHRRRKSCVRFVRLSGSFTRRRPAGADRFAFNGDISHIGALLKPGRYRLLATPIANGRAGKPAHALFRIVR